MFFRRTKFPDKNTIGKIATVLSDLTDPGHAIAFAKPIIDDRHQRIAIRNNGVGLPRRTSGQDVYASGLENVSDQ